MNAQTCTLPSSGPVVARRNRPDITSRIPTAMHTRLSLDSRTLPSFSALVLALAAAMTIAACSSQAEPTAAAPPPEVSVAKVLSKQVSQWDAFTGRVAAVETVDLRPRVSGYIERVAYREGDDVRKGQLLFVIDRAPTAPRSRVPRRTSSAPAANRGSPIPRTRARSR